MNDDRFHEVKKILREYGISDTTNDGPHSWRCEYPERYGECTCLNDLTKDIMTVLDD